LEAGSGVTNTKGVAMTSMRAPKRNHAPASQFSDTHQALHEPFTWLAESVQKHPHLDFVCLSQEISHGIAVCLELVESASISRDVGDIPIIDSSNAGHLLRFAISASKMLGEAADRHIAKANQAALPKSATGGEHA